MFICITTCNTGNKACLLYYIIVLDQTDSEIGFKCIYYALHSYHMVQFSEIPVTIISNFKQRFLSKATILHKILQTKIMTLDITTNTTCQFIAIQYN